MLHLEALEPPKLPESVPSANPSPLVQVSPRARTKSTHQKHRSIALHFRPSPRARSEPASKHRARPPACVKKDGLEAEKELQEATREENMVHQKEPQEATPARKRCTPQGLLSDRPRCWPASVVWWPHPSPKVQQDHLLCPTHGRDPKLVD